jgi:hypothetical protein
MVASKAPETSRNVKTVALSADASTQILEMEKTVWVGPQESTARKAEATKKTCVAAPNKRDPKYQVDRLSEFLASWSMKKL